MGYKEINAVSYLIIKGQTHFIFADVQSLSLKCWVASIHEFGKENEGKTTTQIHDYVQHQTALHWVCHG